MSLKFDIVIIGAGAAGLFCAIQAGKRGKSVLLLDHANKVGKKILMSGGGCCNFTNLYIAPEYYISANPHFCKSALSQYTQWDFIALVDEYRIPYHEKKWRVPNADGSRDELGQGQLFCDNSSKDIVHMLLQECEKYQIAVKTNCRIHNVENGFQIHTSLGEYASEQLVIATGGLSIPKMGATPFAYKIAEQFGMDVLPTNAGLVPFVLTDHIKQMVEALSGISTYVKIYNQLADFSGDLLFTHRGLSGPAVLQLSSYWRPSEDVSIDLMPHIHSNYLLHAKKTKPNSLLRNVLQHCLAKQLVKELQSLVWPQEATLPMQAISHQRLSEIEAQLRSWVVRPAATEGYRTAEVTLGGVNTDALSSKNMQSKQVSGLYFIGEAVDVTGHLGGYNFQWAWSSAYVAAQSF